MQMMQDNTSNFQKGLITFGGLLRLKREFMKLTSYEVDARLKFSNGYCNLVEKDGTNPSLERFYALKDFYRLKDEEIQATSNGGKVVSKLRTRKPHGKPYKAVKDYGKKIALEKITSIPVIEPPAVTKISIETILESLIKITASVDKMDGKGTLAKTIKESSASALLLAIESLESVIILDKLLEF